ncbi:MAG: response regulator [Armatimonadota bacterium]|nr:response regulator [Armatimonadota bacterium]MDR7421882.1 response regulator [Armatimonadota bacterium]MDR7452877.1 response regulator [Armatimonadota bacterium]MDR7456187.1 response regulator [Armatimonadota bacterium]MDR7496387.1 response regulator [Armatimonadota bacterium]
MTVRVLIVDDNLLSCTRLLNQAQAAGWQARAVGPGAEALAHARQHRPDAIVVNLAAASTDPVLFLRALRAEPDLAPVPVLGFCGHRETRRREGAVAAGCNRVVANSAVASDLRAQVERLLAGVFPVGHGV